MQPSPAPGSAALALWLRMGDVEQFRLVRSGLRDLNYTEESICARTGSPSIFDFRGRLEGREQSRELRDALDVLIFLLMDGETIPREQLGRLLPAALVEALTELGIVAAVPDRPHLSFATVALYPVTGLYIASDRVAWIDGTPQTNLKEVVYPAIAHTTQGFLSALPETPCESLLDLCSGTGVAALAGAARYARHAWACDLVARSVRFAEFNCRLNGIENITCGEGDLYQPIGDLTFDRIVAHPPYVASDQPEILYRDGGPDGEQVLRGVIEGLSRHLRPGGRCYAVSMATDREGETVEQRVRRWLGPHESEFDVMLVSLAPKPEPLQQLLKSCKGGALQMPAESELWKKLRVTGVFHGAFVLERKQAARPAVTARIRKAENAGGDAVEWFANWVTSSAAPGFDDLLAGACPHLAATFQLRVIHTVEKGSLTPTRFELAAGYPFVVQAACPNWIAVITGACDGKRNAAEIYADMQRQEVIHPSMTMAQFLVNVRELVQHGMLELDEFPLPKPRG